MSKNNRLSKSILLLFSPALVAILLSSYDLHGQARINSPYSIFAVGEFKGNDYFRNMSMGGISQGFRSNVSVNYLNPASYTAIDSMSFVFDGTVLSHIYQQVDTTRNQSALYTNLGALNFGFPITKWWKFATGIVPWSQVGYRISDFEETTTSGRVNFLYEGTGGINQLFVGNGFQIYKGLSAGVNVSYLFGRSEDLSSAYSETNGFFRTFWSNADRTTGLLLTYGLQWSMKLKNDRGLTLGASYTADTELNVIQNSYIVRSLLSEGIVDTLSSSADNKGKMRIPANISGGLFYTVNPNFGVGADFQMQNWSGFQKMGNSYNLNDVYQFRLGAIYNPRVSNYSGFLNRIEYRGGFRYGQSSITIPDSSGDFQDFTELGISFGIGLPMRRSLSGLNLGFEYSLRSASSSELFRENFFRFNIGINVYERWFFKRKFF